MRVSRGGVSCFPSDSSFVLTWSPDWCICSIWTLKKKHLKIAVLFFRIELLFSSRGILVTWNCVTSRQTFCTCVGRLWVFTNRLLSGLWISMPFVGAEQSPFYRRAQSRHIPETAQMMECFLCWCLPPCLSLWKLWALSSSFCYFFLSRIQLPVSWRTMERSRGTKSADTLM